MTKNNKWLLIVLITLIGIGCDSKSNESDLIITNKHPTLDDSKEIRELTEKMLYGDTTSYLELRSIYFDSGNARHFLRNAIIMSNDFNFAPAYYDVYNLMKTDIVDSLNIKSNKLANYYLLRAYEANVKDSKFSIKERFGKSAKLPNSHSYWISLDKDTND